MSLLYIKYEVTPRITPITPPSCGALKESLVHPIPMCKAYDLYDSSGTRNKPVSDRTSALYVCLLQ